MVHSRARLIGSFAAAGLLGALSVVVQIERDRRYATDRPETEVLYVQSPDVIKRMVLSYDVIAADVYWIRAIQHFGRERQVHSPDKHYALPNLAAFDIKSEVVHGQPVTWGFLGFSIAYAAVYASAVLTLATLIFSRRDFK